MNRIRLLLATISAAMLALGYLASQRASFAFEVADYAQRVDKPPIVLLSLVLFLVAVVLCFVPDKQESPE